MRIQELRESSQAQSLVRRIQSVLSPDLLLPKFRKMCPPDAHKTWGQCYAATEALFHALGGFDGEWVPARGKDDDGIVHWWLEHKQSGEILDPTSEQYTSRGQQPPYDRGRRAGFLTRDPSKRAAQILQLAGLSPSPGDAPVPQA